MWCLHLMVSHQQIADVCCISQMTSGLCAGHLYHTDSRETLLRWRREGDQQSDSDHEAYGDELVDADDLDQDQQLLERLASIVQPSVQCRWQLLGWRLQERHLHQHIVGL